MPTDYALGIINGLTKAKLICEERAAKCMLAQLNDPAPGLTDAYRDAAWVYQLAADYIEEEIRREKEDAAS